MSASSSDPPADGAATASDPAGADPAGADTVGADTAGKRQRRVAAARDRAGLHRLARASTDALVDLLSLAGLDRHCDLAGADLSGASMPGEDLAGCDLAGTDLSGAVLQAADLSGARLYRAIADKVDLARADLRDADCRGASMRHACLANARVQGADFTGADLTGADLTGTGLEAELGAPPPAGDGALAGAIGGLRFPIEALDQFRDGLLWRLVEMGRGDHETLDYIDSIADDLAERQELIARRARLRGDSDRDANGDRLLARTSRDLGLIHWRLDEPAAADHLFTEAGTLWEAHDQRAGVAEMAFARACLALVGGDRQAAAVVLSGLRGGPDLMPRLWAGRALLALDQADPMRARDAIDAAAAFHDHPAAEELRVIGRFLKAAMIAGAGGAPDLDDLAYGTPRIVAMRAPYRTFLGLMRT